MKWLILGLVVFSLIGWKAQDTVYQDTVYKNFQWAKELHENAVQYQRDSGDNPFPGWDKDWVIVYQAYLDEQDGKEIDYEVPDIWAKWERGEYRR